MSLNRILIAGLAATTLSTGAMAGDYYRCNDRLCYDDQADETRRLNQQQYDNPGDDEDAPPPGDYSGQGGPSYDGPPDRDDDRGMPDDNDSQGYGPPPDGDGSSSYGPPPDDDQSYDDQSDDQSPSDDDQYPDDDQ